MSLRTTILAVIAYVLVLVIVVLEVPLVLNLTRRVDAEVRAEAASGAQLLAASARELVRGSLPRLQLLANEASGQLSGRVIVVDRAGEVVVDSAGPGLRGASYAGRPEVAAALAGGTEQGERYSASLDEDLLYTAVPVIAAGRPIGAVRVTQSIAAVKADVRRNAIGLIGVGIAALLVGLAVAWVLAGRLARPPLALAATARRVAAGDLAARAVEDGPREQREVTVAFNEMTSRLADSLDAQREFVGNASHQLRTPLTGLRLRLEAASDATVQPEVRDDLQAAEQEVERLARLVDNLLALARETATAAEPVDLRSAVAEAAERWAGESQARRVRLLVSAREGDPVGAGSRDDLGIVLDNLIENAIEYGGKGTTVRLEYGGRSRSAYVAVIDEGPGLAPGEEVTALERFRRGRAGAGTAGTGLGLAIADSLARRAGGSLRLENREEGGLRAEVELPRLAGSIAS